MHRFSDVEEAESCLRGLMEREQPLAVKLARQTGLKEPRYAHLLSGEPEVQEQAPPGVIRTVEREDRVAALEAEIAELRERVTRVEE